MTHYKRNTQQSTASLIMSVLIISVLITSTLLIIYMLVQLILDPFGSLIFMYCVLNVLSKMLPYYAPKTFSGIPYGSIELITIYIVVMIISICPVILSIIVFNKELEKKKVETSKISNKLTNLSYNLKKESLLGSKKTSYHPLFYFLNMFLSVLLLLWFYWVWTSTGLTRPGSIVIIILIAVCCKFIIAWLDKNKESNWFYYCLFTIHNGNIILCVKFWPEAAEKVWDFYEISICTDPYTLLILQRADPYTLLILGAAFINFTCLLITTCWLLEHSLSKDFGCTDDEVYQTYIDTIAAWISAVILVSFICYYDSQMYTDIWFYRKDCLSVSQINYKLWASDDRGNVFTSDYIICSWSGQNIFVLFALAVFGINLYFFRFKNKFKSYGEMVAGDLQMFLNLHEALFISLFFLYKIRYIHQDDLLWTVSLSELLFRVLTYLGFWLLMCGYAHLLKKFFYNNYNYFLYHLNICIDEISLLNATFDKFFLDPLKHLPPNIGVKYLINYLKLYLSLVLMLSLSDGVDFAYKIKWRFYFFGNGTFNETFIYLFNSIKYTGSIWLYDLSLVFSILIVVDSLFCGFKIMRAMRVINRAYGVFFIRLIPLKHEVISFFLLKYWTIIPIMLFMVVGVFIPDTYYFLCIKKFLVWVGKLFNLSEVICLILQPNTPLILIFIKCVVKSFKNFFSKK